MRPVIEKGDFAVISATSLRRALADAITQRP
jgi:hypothetical protein